jgi:hypothetical protein
MRWRMFSPVMLIFTGLSGCTSIGPGTVARDRFAKRLFSFIMFLFTLTETEGKQGAPVITIPAG